MACKFLCAVIQKALEREVTFRKDKKKQREEPRVPLEGKKCK